MSATEEDFGASAVEEAFGASGAAGEQATSATARITMHAAVMRAWRHLRIKRPSPVSTLHRAIVAQGHTILCARLVRAGAASPHLLAAMRSGVRIPYAPSRNISGQPPKSVGQFSFANTRAEICLFENALHSDSVGIIENAACTTRKQFFQKMQLI